MKDWWTRWMVGMKQPWIRLSLVVAMFLVMVSGSSTLGGWGPRDPHPDASKCPHPACTGTCDPSQYVIGYCSEGKGGKGIAMTYACCCCNEGSEGRWFHGG